MDLEKFRRTFEPGLERKTFLNKKVEGKHKKEKDVEQQFADE